MWRELRLALRRLRRQPGFTVVAVVILALGLGASVTMFSLVSTWVLRALPYPDPDRLVQLRRTDPGQWSGGHSAAAFHVYRQQRQLFEAVAAYSPRDHVLELPGQAPASVWSVDVSAGFLDVLKVRPRLGRGFFPEEEQPGGDRVVLISTRLWHSRFGGDPQIIGRRIRLAGMVHTVVGVMAPEFQDSPRQWVRADLWRLMTLDAEATQDWRNWWLLVIARLQPGVTIDQAAAQLGAVAAHLPSAATGAIGVPRPLSERKEDNTGRAAWLTLALAVLVLVIACVNLIGLQLARIGARGQERAVRLALGASRLRLVREALAESLLVSLTGGALGLLLANAFIQLLGPRMMWGGSRVDFGVALVSAYDPALLAFALLMVLAIALVLGTVPVWLGSPADIARGLRQGGRGTTERAHARLRAAVVVIELVLAVVLLAAGGLFVRGLHRLAHGDAGWSLDGVLFARIDLPRVSYQKPESRQAFHRRMAERVGALAGVGSSTLSTDMPVSPFGDGEFIIEGQPPPKPGQALRIYRNSVTAGFFETLDIELRQGRGFQPADAEPDVQSVIINETMARQLWPGQSALGKRLARLDTGEWWTVIGIVSDVRFPAVLRHTVTPYQAYFPFQKLAAWTVVVTVRPASASLPAAALAADLRRAVAELDPALPLVEPRTPRTVVERAHANFSLLGWILSAFAALGLLLSGLGVYGLFSGYVVERTQEIGVRMALGARGDQVVARMLGIGLRLALLGLGLGLLAALGLGPVLRAAIEVIPVNDPAVVAPILALIVAVLVAVALLACWLPARRAAAVDPMVALRSE